MRMPRHSLHKERWTITFDPTLKTRIQQEARKLRVYPVQLLETLVREKLNPYGFQTVGDSIQYVNSIRAKTSRMSDKSFLTQLKKWQKN